MIKLFLLGTQGCHLCELADELVESNLIGACDVAVERIDIAEQGEWQERYAVRIPVLLHPASGIELGWPFDNSDVAKFIEISKQKTL